MDKQSFILLNSNSRSLSQSKKILNEYRDFLRSPLSIYKNVLEVFFIEWV